MSKPLPMQPLVMVGKVVRFKANAVVAHLLREASQGRRCSLNDLGIHDFPQADCEQFYQLIGYSLCGYHELSNVSDESALAASKQAKKTWPDAGGCRDDGCEIHIGVAKEEP